MIGETELLQGLAAVGFEVESIAELRTSGRRYPEAIPVLLAALRQARDPKLKEEAVRALSVPWAKPLATPALIDEFRHVEDETGLGLRWTVGNALEVVWDDSCFDDLVALACDPGFGRAREMVVVGMGRSRRAEAGAALIRLLEDPVVAGHAVKALRKLKVPAARAGLERMLGDRRAWVRNEARRALDAL